MVTATMKIMSNAKISGRTFHNRYQLLKWKNK